MFCTFLSNQTFQTQLRFKEQLVEYIFLRNTAWAGASEFLLCFFFWQFRWHGIFCRRFQPFLTWNVIVRRCWLNDCQGSPGEPGGHSGWGLGSVHPSRLGTGKIYRRRPRGRGGGPESCKAVGFVPFSDESWIRELVISAPQITRLTKVDNFCFLFSAFQAF